MLAYTEVTLMSCSLGQQPDRILQDRILNPLLSEKNDS